MRKQIDTTFNGVRFAVAGRALARLNAQEAVADFDKIIAENEKGYVFYNWAKVMRARLLAQSPSLPNDAAQRFAVFLKAIDRTPQQFDKAIREYSKKTPEEKAETYSMEVTALAELSDMIYRGDSEAWLKLPEVKTLDVSGVRAAKYRMQFAALPIEKRATAIVDALVAWENNRPANSFRDAEARFLLRMAIDEGTRGAKAAIEKLNTLNANHEKYAKQQNGTTVYPVLGWMTLVVEDTKAVELLPELEVLKVQGMTPERLEMLRTRMSSNRTARQTHFIEGLQAR